MKYLLFLVIFTVPLVGFSADYRPSYLVTLDDANIGHDWQKKTCNSLHAGLNSVQLTNTTCLRTLEISEGNIKIAKQRRVYKYQITVGRAEFPNALITVENWRADSPTDFNKVSYKVDFTNSERFQEFLFRLARNLNNYDNRKISISKLLDKVYEADLAVYKGETFTNKINFKRLVIESGAALGFGAFWYYSDDSNENDWQHESFQSSIESKLNGETVRYDDNSKLLNVGHAFAGMLYHQVGRANGLTQTQAFLSSFVMSAAWEMLVEYREIFSINDTIHTAFAGPVIGEVFYQMARSLRKKNSILAKSLAVVLDGPSAVNRWLDRNKDITENEANYKDEFKFELGWNEVGLEGEVWSLPEGEKVKAFVPQGFYSQLKANAGFGAYGLEEYQLLTKIAYLGYTARDRKKNKNGTYSGYEFIVSGASEFDWRDRYADDDFMVHARVLGTSVILNGEIHGVRVNASYEFYGDFALLRSYALKAYSAENSLDGFPGIVKKEQYYYGLGITHKAGLSVSKGRFTLGANYEINSIKAVTGRDRYQEDVDTEFKAKDKYSRLELFLEMMITPRVSATVGVEEVRRSGTLYAYKSKDKQRAVTGKLSYKF